MPEGINASDWLDLGAVGAVLLIVLVIIILMFKQQSNSVDKLCTKIDVLVTSFTTTNQTLSNVILANDKDQKEVLHKLDDMNQLMHDIHKRVVRMDTRMYITNLADHDHEPEQ